MASASSRTRDGTDHPLRFVAGLFGVTQEATTGALGRESALVDTDTLRPAVLVYSAG